MNVREILFPNFPRMCGNPKSFFIYSYEELNRFATINSSDNDKNFCSVCSYDNENNPVFEDIFFETDEINPEPVRKVVLWFESHNIPWICLHSGSRGFHLHGLFQPDVVNSKTVKKFASMILEETDTTEFFDPHVSGVLEKLCRIPNTQRLGNGWCVPILKEELFNLNTPEEFKKLCVAPRFIDFKIGERHSIFEFIKEDTTIDKPIEIIETSHPKDVFFLKQILRPCVYNAIITPNPRHVFRIDATIEALNHSITVEQLINTYEKINWIDYDRTQTRYQIEYIDNKRRKGELRVFGKKKLGCIKKGSCFKCILNGE